MYKFFKIKVMPKSAKISLDTLLSAQDREPVSDNIAVFLYHKNGRATLFEARAKNPAEIYGSSDIIRQYVIERVKSGSLKEVLSDKRVAGYLDNGDFGVRVVNADSRNGSESDLLKHVLIKYVRDMKMYLEQNAPKFTLQSSEEDLALISKLESRKPAIITETRGETYFGWLIPNKEDKEINLIIVINDHYSPT